MLPPLLWAWGPGCGVPLSFPPTPLPVVAVVAVVAAALFLAKQITKGYKMVY